jgi:hypothetical protein
MRGGEETIEHVAVVNSDCELRDGWLETLLRGMEDTEAGLVGFARRPDGEEPLFRPLREPAYVNPAWTEPFPGGRVSAMRVREES